MPNCPNCGQEIDPAGLFCGSCGSVIGTMDGDATVRVRQAPVKPAAPAAPVQPAYQAPIAPATPAEPVKPAAPAAPVQPAYQAPAQPAYQAPAAPVYQAPVQPVYQQAPVYQTPAQPAYQAPQQRTGIDGGTRAKGIVGMALGIGGFALAIIGMIYVLIGLDFGYGLSMGFAVGFGIFSLPLSIVGRILAGKSQDMGNDSKMCSVGRVLGLVGIIVTAVMFLFGIMSCTY